MSLAPNKQIGEYTIVRKIAEGGMAEVYLATRTGAGDFTKTCVVKRILPKFSHDPAFVRMFEQEALLVARLEHPNIVQIFDFQSTGKELFLAMQYVDGCSLAQLQERLPHGWVPPFIAARIALEIARALAFMHGHPDRDGRPLSLVHRDVSPQNILLSKVGEVKLSDFGVAKPMTKETTQQRKGKVPYMPPEQFNVGPLDARTDLFALGVVLYEMLAGCRPFDGTTETEVMLRLTSGVPADPVTRWNPSVPSALARVVAKAVELAPADRFASGEAFGAALEEVLALAPSGLDADLARFLRERLGGSGEWVVTGTEPTVASPRGQTVDGSKTLSDRPPSATPGVRREAMLSSAEEFVPQDKNGTAPPGPSPRARGATPRLVSEPDIDLAIDLTRCVGDDPDHPLPVGTAFEFRLLEPRELPAGRAWIVVAENWERFPITVSAGHTNKNGEPRWYFGFKDFPKE